MKAVHSSIERNSGKPWAGGDIQGKTTEQLAETVKSTSGMIENYRTYSARFCSKVDPDLAASFLQAAFPGVDATNQATKWGKVLDVLNVDLYAECDEDLKTAVDSVSGRLRYTRLEEGGPKMGELNEECVATTLINSGADDTQEPHCGDLLHPPSQKFHDVETSRLGPCPRQQRLDVGRRPLAEFCRVPIQSLPSTRGHCLGRLRKASLRQQTVGQRVAVAAYDRVRRVARCRLRRLQVG